MMVQRNAPARSISASPAPRARAPPPMVEGSSQLITPMSSWAAKPMISGSVSEDMTNASPLACTAATMSVPINQATAAATDNAG